MPRKEFSIALTEYDRLRVLILTVRGRVEDFVVQLETFIDKWVPVVRYNYAHGFPHRDLLYADGRKEKEKLTIMSLEEVVIFAIKDLRENYITYLRRLGYAQRENRTSQEES